MIERPAARYGRQRLSRRARRRIAIGLTLLIVAVGVVIALIGYQRLGTAEVKGELSAYRLIDGHTAEVTIGVTRQDPAQPVVCIVRARSVDGSEVGRRELLVPPSDRDTVQVTTIVKTTREPAVGDVYGCGTDVPSYLVTPSQAPPAG
ncbi:DUF4307 domain-containing protein [Mycolicibacterium grossiae]|uniref:DUF4307 domain-containing protein n=1 Tax=Mycolicibacterium grossiae TaxID=1552759 RepID=A0A1E8Q9F1_9MYCO|nr:DUF4307 domain-containing protein [Mycolicibacterium grossiae]OFJ55066.1 hypothetical protein BEL07_03670 [Mycolicibacterium grossiae]QEM47839.1 DUF4307 domain-containing protein [Mycolicibacterium grossiae]